MKSLKIDLELLTSDQGGRREAMKSGYLGNLFVGDRYTGVRIDLLYRSELAPGERGLATAVLPNWGYVSHLVREGSTFGLKEGENLVAKGVVLQVEVRPGDQSHVVPDDRLRV